MEVAKTSMWQSSAPKALGIPLKLGGVAKTRKRESRTSVTTSKATRSRSTTGVVRLIRQGRKSVLLILLSWMDVLAVIYTCR